MILDLKKINGKLEPADAYSEELMSQLSGERTIRAKLTVPRNPQFNKKFRLLLTAVIQQSDFYTGKKESLAMEELLDRIKLGTLHYTIDEFEVDDPNKEYPVYIRRRRAKSISFAAMDEIQFTEFYDSALDVIRADEELNVPELVLREFQ
jgi:hypothetical protein